MSKRDPPTTEGLPIVPTTGDGDGAFDLEVEGGDPDALGFDLRFEGGKALLALEDVEFTGAIRIKRALFEVPDVEFPLDVTGGSARFQDKRLILRAVELELRHTALIDVSMLERSGLTLSRERTRAGGVELLLSANGPSGAVPLRARGILVAAGESGVALVLHEVITFGPSPRSRLEVAERILDAFAIPGGHEARGMVRRADPFRSVFARLLPAYGWKVPALGEVRVHDALINKGLTTLRAWAGDRPDGWKKARKPKKGPLNDAVALAVFADDLSGDAAARAELIDNLVDEDAVPVAVAPYAAEIYRADERRRAEGDDLVNKALASAPDHLGVLSAVVDESHLSLEERGARLVQLAKAADNKDEPWVASHAYSAAAKIARDENRAEYALELAEAAWRADPTNGEIGLLLVDLAASSGHKTRALEAGRGALERVDSDEAEALSVRLAHLALELEGPGAARELLRRALRRADRRDALLTLARVELKDGAIERASEVLARLLLTAGAETSGDVQLLAAEIAEARGDDEAARMHLGRARELAPDDTKIALRLAALHKQSGDEARAIDVLQSVATQEPPDREVINALAEALIARATTGDAERALQLVARIEGDPRARRLDAEARANLDDVVPLATLLEDEGREGDSDALTRSAELYLAADRPADAGRVLAASVQSGGDLLALATSVSALTPEVAAVAIGALVTALDDAGEVGATAHRPLQRARGGGSAGDRAPPFGAQ